MKQIALHQSLKIFCILFFMLNFAHCNLNLERDPLQLISALGLVQPGGGSGASDENDSSGFTLGGTVSGLSGSGLVLRLNSSEDLSVGANGNFQFGTTFTTGQTYTVTVGTQPSGPTQSCTITNGSGTFAEANVSNITVQCLSIPVLSSITPANYSNLATTGSIVVNFTKTMNTGSCNLNPGLTDSLLAGNAYTTEWSETNRPNDTLTISPNTSWNVGLNRILRITNCADTDGLVAASGGSLDFDALFYITATADALRYVATTGTNVGPCTDRLNPCQTIEYAYGQLAPIAANCIANGDCAVLVGSGNYAPGSTIEIQNGRSIIGSFDANFQSRDVFNSPTNILPGNLPACGTDAASACRNIFVQNVTSGSAANPGTRLETIRIVARDNVEYSHALGIGNSSTIRLDTVIARAGDSNLADAVSYGMLVEGSTINLRLNTGIYTSATMTGAGATSSAIRVVNSNNANITMTGVGLNLRDSPTRHGFYLSASNSASVDMRFSGIHLVEDLANTNESYGFRMQGNLFGSVLVLGFNTIRSFSANQRSVGLSLESGNNWNSTPTPVIYNNQISGGRIESAVGNYSYGVNIQRFGGKIINNRIVGGQLTEASGGEVAGINSVNSPSLRLYQNSIASGSGNSQQFSVKLSGTDTNNWIISNNNFASNTNPSSRCMDYTGVVNPTNHIMRNNNFHSCSGAHVRFNSANYFRSNCAGTPGQEGNLALSSDCTDPLSDGLPVSTISGNIDVNASFQIADPNNLAVNVWDWNLNLRTNGTAACILARGAREITSSVTDPVNVQDIINIDRRNNTRTNSDTSVILNPPTGASGRSIGAYEFDGTCL